jgi:hypothetical protein
MAEALRGMKEKISKLSNLEFFKIVAANGDPGSEESRFIYPTVIANTLGL